METITVEMYKKKFGKYPPKFIGVGTLNYNYLAMLDNAIENNKPITEEDIKKYIPFEKGAIY